MKKKLIVVVAAGLLMLSIGVTVSQAGMFVATVQNFRGAMYQGFGPSPGHACENAMVKCSQDSFVPPSCKVLSVRMECPPPVCMAPPPPMPVPMRKPVRKIHPVPNCAAGYPWGRPMP